MSKDCNFCYESYIKKHFTYDPDSGIITRDDRKNSNGSLDTKGYIILKIKGKQFKAHRIAWFLHTGKFPENVIDHINRDRSDNRIVNLRDVKCEVNVNNIERTPNKDTGEISIYYDTSTKGLRSKYTTSYERKKYRFRTLEEAINFRISKGLPTKENYENK